MWNELRTELNVGQFLDILGSVRARAPARAKAERIARYKSGKYTIERPLHLGALLAAPERADALLAAAEHASGCRSATPSRCATTSSACSATRRRPASRSAATCIEGKPTPLLARAVALASPAQQEPCSTASAPTASMPTGVAAIQQVIVDTGALAELEAAIDRFGATPPIDALVDASISNPRRDAPSWSRWPTTWSVASG